MDIPELLSIPMGCLSQALIAGHPLEQRGEKGLLSELNNKAAVSPLRGPPVRTESPLCEMPCPWRGLLCAGLPVAKSAADHRLPPERASLPPCRSGLWLLHSGVGRAPTCCSGPLGPGQPPGHPRWVCEERGGADPSPGPSQVAQW